MEITPLRLTVTQAAKALNMSRAKAYRRIAEGVLQAHRDGGQTFVSRAALDRYIAALEHRCQAEEPTAPVLGRYEYGDIPMNPRRQRAGNA